MLSHCDSVEFFFSFLSFGEVHPGKQPVGTATHGDVVHSNESQDRITPLLLARVVYLIGPQWHLRSDGIGFRVTVSNGFNLFYVYVYVDGESYSRYATSWAPQLLLFRPLKEELSVSSYVSLHTRSTVNVHSFKKRLETRISISFPPAQADSETVKSVCIVDTPFWPCWCAYIVRMGDQASGITLDVERGEGG